MTLRLLLAILLVCPILVRAEIYKAVDENGHVTYSSTPIQGGKKLNLPPLPTMDTPRPPSPSAGFPKVDGETQKSRDDTRYMILQNELTEEERLLAEAKQNLQEGESNPEVFRGKDGRTYRNVAKYDEKVKALSDQVELHQRNVDALKIELSKLK